MDDVLDILYTPIDCGPPPQYDLKAIREWIAVNYDAQAKYREFLNAKGRAAEHIIENYPWNLTPAYWNLMGDGPGWLGGFDKLCPDLAAYLPESFGIPIEDFGMMLLLPIKDQHTGLGFWHNDSDSLGMRMYLEFEEPTENKLLMRRTKERYASRVGFQVPMDESVLQAETLECKLLHQQQCFFLNNVRAVHATYTAIPNKTRIAVLMTPKFTNAQSVNQRLKDLIIRSAAKFPEHALMWKPEPS